MFNGVLHLCSFRSTRVPKPRWQALLLSCREPSYMLALPMVHPDEKRPQVAPAPVPSPEARARAARTQGFGRGGRGWRWELALLLAAPLLLGAGVVWGGAVVAVVTAPLVPLEVDRYLGQVSQYQLGLTSRECVDSSAKAYVEKLAAPLLAAVPSPPFEFQFRVVADPSINAYALPGGFVTVNWGLLEAADRPGEVAGVLGHALSHALLRHGVRRPVRHAGAGVALTLLVGGTDAALMARLSQELLSLSYDREQEAEADRKGLDLLVRAGIDHEGLAVFLEGISQEALDVPELISTHPDPGRRGEMVAEARRSVRFEPAHEVWKDLPPLAQVRCN